MFFRGFFVGTHVVATEVQSYLISSFSVFFADSALAQSAPAMLCQTLNTAPGTAAIGIVAKCVCASVQASPEFCIPTSTDTAVLFRLLILNARASSNPSANPQTLCKATATMIVSPTLSSWAELADTTEPTIRTMTIDEMAGR